MVDKEHLRDILNQTRSLNHMEYDKAERLKKKAASAFRVLFGSGFGVERISFTSNFGFADQDFERQTFYRAKNELESLLESKIADIIQRELEIKKQKEKESASPSIASQILDGIVENRDYEKRIDELTSELLKISTDLREKTNEVESLRGSLEDAKKLRLFKDTSLSITIGGILLAAGAFSVGLKVDYEKRELQKEVDVKNDSLKILSKKLMHYEKQYQR